MRRLIYVLLATSTLAGQEFEVASIKQSGPHSPLGWEGGPGTRDPGQYTYGQVTAFSLIGIAYGVKYNFQISSKIRLDKEHFDLAARLPAGTTKEQFQAMMRNFLVQRFHLQAHVESREFSGYELVVAKGGLKLKQAADSPPGTVPGLSSTRRMIPGGEVVHVEVRQQPMSKFAEALTAARAPIQAPIVDRTGLTGKYDFAFDYTSEFGTGPVDTPTGVPELFHAIEQQLGLTLVPKKVPFVVVVVEAIDKMPVEN